jgi:hypothetical protein
MISIDLPEGLRFLSLKIVHSMKFLVDQGFSHIFRTTLSSILNYDLFFTYLQRVESSSILYAGSQGDYNGLKFVSGANMLVNELAINHLFDNRRNLDFTVLDDIAFAKILIEKIHPVPITSCHISSLKDLQNLTDVERQTIIHYRCKSSSSPRNDIELINGLNAFLDHR